MMSDQVRVLYMEDNEGTARLFQKRLGRAGYTIDLAANGEIGLEMCATQPYDAIVVDQNMPGMSGLRVIEQLISQNTTPPLIMLTGTGNERIAVEALKMGAFDYVVKDVDGIYFDLLPTVIDQALKNRQLLESSRRAEAALRESEKRLRSLIEQSFDGITLIDQDGKIIEWNRSQERLTNVTRETAVGQHIWDMLAQIRHPESSSEAFKQMLKDSFLEMLHDRKSPLLEDVFEYEFQRADGEDRAVQVSRFLIDLGHDRFLISEIARDISERKRMEDALRESEKRFRMLFEKAPDPYFVSDLDGQIVDCNRAAVDLLGVSASELIGTNYSELPIVNSSQLTMIGEEIANNSETLFSKSTELTIISNNDEKIIVDIHLMPIQIKGQALILGIAHDITWRKQAEAKMQAYIEQLERLHHIDEELTRKLDTRYVLAMALESMMRLSSAKAGSIALVNDEKIDDVYAIGYPEPLDPYFSGDTRSIVKRVLQQRQVEWVEDVTADPDYLAIIDGICSQIAIPLLSQERLIGVVSLESDQKTHFDEELFEFLQLIAARIAIAIDNARLYDNSQRQLTQLQDLYEQVSALEQLKTDMVRIVSHDLRNPLTTAGTFVSLLERSLSGSVSEKQQGYISQIKHALKQMKNLTTDVLSVDNIEQMARGDISSEPINLTELIRNLVADSRIHAERKNQLITFSSPDIPIVIHGNEVELRQAATNLINNAIKYTPEHGQITVSVRCQEDAACLEVIDTGYGIPIENQANIFQPFERVKTDETRTIEGTGLGLYIVKKIVERNRGEVIFSSEHGKGSVFGFKLPLPKMN